MRDNFSGSYLKDDVTFLLKQIKMPSISIYDKEVLIQSGTAHYSETISEEIAPSENYLNIFYDSFARNKLIFARHICQLASIISANVKNKITIVSLARAGTPIGILLKRVLEQIMGRRADHYSISIIRDRGIDENAINYILSKKCDVDSIVFVDGWTGKGVINSELKKSIQNYNFKYKTRISSKLYVISDLCGHADFSSSHADYLIPSGVLNSTISGLVSRSILNSLYIKKSDFHGCIYYDSLQNFDLSRWFIDSIFDKILEVDDFNFFINTDKAALCESNNLFLKNQSNYFISNIMAKYNVLNINYVKPGIGESTRVMLRRIPDILLLRDDNMPDVQHLLILAKEKKVSIIVSEDLPYNAVALIQNLKL